MILTDIQEKIKGLPDMSANLFTFLAIILVGGGVFLGFSIFQREYVLKSPTTISSQIALLSLPQATSSGQGSAVEKGIYVASRSGSFYYLPSCNGAKRIKEKNMIWFTTKEDAEARGLHPAHNCLGL
jgi:hypothetical protein